MKIPHPVVMIASSGVTTFVSIFWQHSVEIMLPWLFVIYSAVIADLASGKYKSGRLGIHFAWSTAIRESFGKLIVYAAAVMTFAMFDVAAEGDATVAKWLSVMLSAVEIGSVISNILICHGIKLSLKAILKLMLKKSPFGIDDEAADEIIRAARREDMKWNRAGNRKFNDADEPLHAFCNRPYKIVRDEETGKITYEHNED